MEPFTTRHWPPPPLVQPKSDFPSNNWIQPLCGSIVAGVLSPAKGRGTAMSSTQPSKITPCHKPRPKKRLTAYLCNGNTGFLRRKDQSFIGLVSNPQCLFRDHV